MLFTRECYVTYLHAMKNYSCPFPLIKHILKELDVSSPKLVDNTILKVHTPTESMAILGTPSKQERKVPHDSEWNSHRETVVLYTLVFIANEQGRIWVLLLKESCQQ